MDPYTAWTQAELQWAEPLRNRKRKLLRKVFLLILLPFLGGALIVPFAMWKFVSDPAEAVAYGLLLLFFGLLLTLLVALLLLPQTSRRSFAGKLKKSAARLAPDASRQALLGQDLLEALENPRRHFDYTNPEQNNAPLHFVLGRHYAYISGGWDYKPFLLPLAEVRSFSAGEKGAVLNGKTVRHYYIWFDGLPQRDGFAFHDRQSRDRALAMLQDQSAGRL